MRITSEKVTENLYLVKLDEEDVATYRWWLATSAKPPSAKHMELNIYPSTMDKAVKIDDGVRTILLPIYNHVFFAVLKMTYQASEKLVCKMYASSEATRLIYRIFANQLGSEYNVKSHGNWIYVRQSASHSSLLEP